MKAYKAESDSRMSALDKWQRIKNGSREIVSNADLDIIETQTEREVLRLTTIPNPNRVGILDAYVAFIK